KFLSVLSARPGRVRWGHGRGGRLGHGDENVRMVPTAVAALTDASKVVVAVAAGEKHTLALTENGAVYSWG
ncbi:unnamed protein product, partial [Phaeothamnion confervicola]